MTSQAFSLVAVPQWQPAVLPARRPAPCGRLAAGALVAHGPPALGLVLALGARGADAGRAVLKRARAAAGRLACAGRARLHGPRRAARAGAVADENTTGFAVFAQRFCINQALICSFIVFIRCFNSQPSIIVLKYLKIMIR